MTDPGVPACNKCKGGTLKALFEVKTRTPGKPKTAAESRLSSAAPRDSPRGKTPLKSLVLDLSASVSALPRARKAVADGSGSDLEVEKLVGMIEGVSLQS